MVSKPLLLWLSALTLLQPIRAEDTVSSGNYLIHDCNSGQPFSHASKLQNLLPQIYDGLQNVIVDLQQGTASAHGYSAFFKNDSIKAEVLGVYQQMAAGANVHTRYPRNRVSLRRPTFICANDQTNTALLYQYCTQSENAPLITWMKTEVIVLCPVFWSMQQQATLSECPLVVQNTLTPNDDRLLGTQEALLVASLVHLYHDFYDIDATVFGIADASELNSSASLLNPPNYAMYYAAVQAGCTRFPNMQEPHDELRHLLEVPADSNDTNTTLPAYSEIPSYVPRPPDLDTLQDFCNGAVYAPNQTVCCDESTGLWKPAPVIRDGPAATGVSASCPQNTGGTGGPGAGSGVIHTRRRRMTNGQ